MSFTLVFSEIAIADINKHKKSGDKAVLKKLEILLNELMEHPTTGTGQPEQLKYHLKGLYSRRINQKHRLVYSVDEQHLNIRILSAYAHYRDK